MLSECKLRVNDGGKRITYHVWASPTFPGIGTMNTLSHGGYDVESAEVETEGVRIKKEDIVNFVSDDASIKREEMEHSFDILQTAFKSIFEKIEEGKKESIEAFSGFGSCAYVTLSRDVETSPIKTTDATQEIVTKLEIATDKKEYESEETITIRGVLEINGEPAKGKEVTVETIQFVIGQEYHHEPKRVLTDENGAFLTQTKLELDATDTLQVVAIYKGSKSEPYRFTVG
jgi:hypothetical protein